ncbi:MAG: hypothetical protein ACRDC4_15115 [Plesiomonas sp.]
MNKWLVGGIVAFIIAAVLMIVRVVPWTKCVLAEYDLKRETSFSWVTGKCMVTRVNGERVYLDQMRDSGE